MAISPGRLDRPIPRPVLIGLLILIILLLGYCFMAGTSHIWEQARANDETETSMELIVEELKGRSFAEAYASLKEKDTRYGSRADGVSVEELFEAARVDPRSFESQESYPLYVIFVVELIYGDDGQLETATLMAKGFVTGRYDYLWYRYTRGGPAEFEVDPDGSKAKEPWMH